MLISIFENRRLLASSVLLIAAAILLVTTFNMVGTAPLSLYWKYMDDFTTSGFKDSGNAIFRVQTGSIPKCCLHEDSWTSLSSSHSLKECQEYCNAEAKCSGLLRWVEEPSRSEGACEFCHQEVMCKKSEVIEVKQLTNGVKLHSYTVERRKISKTVPIPKAANAEGDPKSEEISSSFLEESSGGGSESKEDPCVISDAVVKYVESRIREAPVGRSPYPHVYIRSVFPNDFYHNCMMRNLPPVTSTSKLYVRSSHTASARWSHKISELRTPVPAGVNSTLEDGRKLRELSDFWKNWAKTFTSKSFAQLWLQKFKMTTGKRGIDFKTKEDRFFYSAELNRDLSGFSVGPHTDGTAKWVTTLYYLPKDNRLVNKGGTLVGKFRDGRSQPGASKWMNFDKYEVIRKAQFAPNSLVAFAPCHTSWHAVAPIAPGVARDSIQAFVSSKDKIPKGRCG